MSDISAEKLKLLVFASDWREESFAVMAGGVVIVGLKVFKIRGSVLFI